MGLDNQILIPRHLGEHLLIDAAREPCPKLRYLLSSWAYENELSGRVQRVMQTIDRQHYLNSEEQDCAYEMKEIKLPSTPSCPHP